MATSWRAAPAGATNISKRNVRRGGGEGRGSVFLGSEQSGADIVDYVVFRIRPPFSLPNLFCLVLMSHFASAAMSVERYTEYFHGGVEELYDAPIEDWVGARWHGHAQEGSDDSDDEDDCMSDAETTPATDGEIFEQLGHEQTRLRPLPEEERVAVGSGQTRANRLMMRG
eukprot:2445291-Pyramimonas_sp.AAC.1